MGEVALAVVLVVGAGLLLRSFWNLMKVDAGFNRSRLVTFGVVLPQASYQAPQSRVDFSRRLIDQLRQIPGVQGAAGMTGLPPMRLVNANDTDFEDYTPPGQQGPFENVDYYQTVTQEYLTTMGIPVIEGRDFMVADTAGTPVVMVNETLAKTFYKDRSPIGKRLRVGFNPKNPWLTIVGVVRDVKQGGVGSKTGTELYFMAEQGRLTNFAPSNMNIVIRSALPVESLVTNIQDIVRTMDPTLPIVRLRTMEDVFSESVARPRFLAQLLGLFAGLALLLAAIGTYGILSYTVSERRKEIGIHMALGATRQTVLGMVLGQGARLTVAGLVIGLAASLVLTRFLQAQLFNVRPTDPGTIAAVMAFIAVVAGLACYVPASRATRVDPMVVLRDE
jgi:putative ABC transport system permease protein